MGNEDDGGLMDFGARFYDPRLGDGRFLQLKLANEIGHQIWGRLKFNAVDVHGKSYSPFLEANYSGHHVILETRDPGSFQKKYAPQFTNFRGYFKGIPPPDYDDWLQ